MAERASTDREDALRSELADLRSRLEHAQRRIEELERGAPDTEARLRESEERLRLIIDLVPHFIFAKDAEGRFLLLNQAVAEAFGARVQDVVGKTDADFVPEHEGERFRRDDLAVIESGSPVFVPEETITTASGEVRYLQTVKIPYTEPVTDRPAILGVAVDITERKRGEEERLKLEARLREARRLESLGLLAGGLAHDFNNLVQVILGNIDLAMEGLPEGGEALECLEQGAIAGRRASELCDQMFAYAGRVTGGGVPVDVAALVRETAELLSVVAPAETSLEVSAAEDVPPVRADRTQLRQVFLNLASNAVDAVEGSGGRIRLSIDVTTPAGDELEELFPDERLPAGEYVRVEVEDDGVGMDGETLARVFDPFFSTKSSGHGLGLAAVTGIVRSHGGAIRATSRPGSGTSFVVYLPGARGEVVEEPAAPVEVRPWRGAGRVLVVDDDEGVRSLAARCFERVGFTTATAARGEEALELVRREGGDLALVLLDLTMPGTSGAETLAHIRELAPDLPVILTSGFREPAALADLDPSAPVVFLQKPFRSTELAEAARRLLARSGDG